MVGARTARGAFPHGSDEVLDLLEDVRVQRVVHPAALPPVGDEAGILERLQVEREPRLARVERVRQVADALLAAEKFSHDPKTRFVRQGVEETREPRDVRGTLSPDLDAR